MKKHLFIICVVFAFNFVNADSGNSNLTIADNKITSEKKEEEKNKKKEKVLDKKKKKEKDKKYNGISGVFCFIFDFLNIFIDSDDDEYEYEYKYKYNYKYEDQDDEQEYVKRDSTAAAVIDSIKELQGTKYWVTNSNNVEQFDSLRIVRAQKISQKNYKSFYINASMQFTGYTNEDMKHVFEGSCGFKTDIHWKFAKDIGLGIFGSFEYLKDSKIETNYHFNETINGTYYQIYPRNERIVSNQFMVGIDKLIADYINIGFAVGVNKIRNSADVSFYDLENSDSQNDFSRTEVLRKNIPCYKIMCELFIPANGFDFNLGLALHKNEYNAAYDKYLTYDTISDNVELKFYFGVGVSF